MEELQNTEGDVPRKLDAQQSKAKTMERIDVNERNFRWMMNENAMATEKLAEGIRGFTGDTLKLEKYIGETVQSEVA